MRHLVFSLFSVFLLLNCSESALSEKFDPALAQKIMQIEKQGSDESIAVIGQCKTKITDELKTDLSNTGANVESTVEAVFTATCKIDELKKIAELDFVKHLQLSQERYPTQN